jgi:hypothetical protein
MGASTVVYVPDASPQDTMIETIAEGVPPSPPVVLPVTKLIPELPILVAVFSGAVTYCLVVSWLWYELFKWLFHLVWKYL